MPKNPFSVPVPIKPDDANWRDWYNKIYIPSRWWQFRRDLYVKYCNGYCEANWNGFRCSNLGTQVHHLNYSNLHNERDDDLMLLCRDCHERKHKWPKAANDNGQLTFLFDRLDQKKKSETG